MRKYISFACLFLLLTFTAYAYHHEDYLNLYDRLVECTSSKEVQEMLIKNKSLLDDKFINVVISSANYFFQEGKFLESYTNWAIVHEIGKVKGDEKLEAKGLIELGRCFEKLENGEKAFQCYNMGFNLSQKTKWNKGILLSLLGLSRVTLKKGNVKDADKYAKKALDLAKSMNDKVNLSEAFRILALVHFQKGESEKSFQFLNKALEAAKVFTDHNALVKVYGTYIVLSLSENKLSETEKFLNELLDIIDKNSISYGEVLSFYGVLSLMQGQFEKAIEYAQKSKDIFKTKGAGVLEAKSSIFMGKVYVKMGKIEEAIKCVQEARYIYNEYGAVDGYLNALLFLSVLYYKKGNMNIALGYAQESLDGFKTMDNPLQIASHIMMYLIQRKKGNVSKASNHLEIVRKFGLKNRNQMKAIVIKLSSFGLQKSNKEGWHF